MKALQQLFGSSSGSRIEAIESKSNRESPPPGLTDISNTTTPSPSSKYTMGSTDRSVAVAPPLLLNEQHDSTTSPLQQSSYRSEASAGSSVNIYSNRNNSTTATSATVKAQKLHSNLMRCQIRDPYNIYIVIRELGSGSMGSVQMVRVSLALLLLRILQCHMQSHVLTNLKISQTMSLLQVQKKTAAMGGSARKEFVVSMAIKPTKQIECCQCGPLLNNLSERMVKLLPGQKQNLVEAMPIPNPKTLFHQTSSLVDYSRDPIKQSTQYYALKSLHLNQCANAQLQKELRNEVAILKTLDHPHIARALETFEFQGSLYICLELCSGGDLYFRDPYTEYEAAQILYSLTSSVRYLHLHDIIHRDLKFENCMFASCDSPVEGKLAWWLFMVFLQCL